MSPVDYLQETPEPGWGYRDLLLFLGLAAPSLLISLFLVRGIASFLPGPTPNKATIGLYAQFVSYAFWLAALWAVLKIRHGANVAEALAWVLPRRGLLQVVLAGPALAISVALIARLLRTPEIDDPFLKLVSGRLSIAVLGFCVVALGPIFEELLFRGFLLPLLVRDLGAALGVFSTAVPFALMHGPQYSWQWQHVLLITLVGATLGAVRYRMRSTLASTGLHVSYNTTLFAGYLAELLRRSAS